MVWGLNDPLFGVKWAEWMDRTPPGSSGIRRGPGSEPLLPRGNARPNRGRGDEAVDGGADRCQERIMDADQVVTVFGAYGHTGRFVVAELRRRGMIPILSGRDPEKLTALARSHVGVEIRPATIEDPASLDRAFAGAGAVINCAGPFGETAPAVIEAALRSRTHYLDVTGEALVQPSTPLLVMLRANRTPAGCVKRAWRSSPR